MRWLGRILLNTLTALSLLICVMTAILWPRSRWYGDSYETLLNHHDLDQWETWPAGTYYYAACSSEWATIHFRCGSYACTQPAINAQTFGFDSWRMDSLPFRGKAFWNPLAVDDWRPSHWYACWSSSEPSRAIQTGSPVRWEPAWTGHILVVPHWLVILLTAPLPMWRLALRTAARRRDRPQQGPRPRVQLVRRLGSWVLNGVTLLCVLSTILAVALRTRSLSRCEQVYVEQRRTYGWTYLILGSGAGGARLAWQFEWGTAEPIDWTLVHHSEDTVQLSKNWRWRHDDRWRLHRNKFDPQAYAGGSYDPQSIPRSGFDASFQLSHNQDGREWSGELVAPNWFLILLFSLLPIARYLAMRRWRRRIVTGYCVACGYDLRATPNRCPECGTAAEAMPNRLQGESVVAPSQA